MENSKKQKPYQRVATRVSRILHCKKGNSTPLTIALVLILFMLICAVSEYFRFMIIVQGVRDGLQSAVITVSTTNYDELYNGLREGYSGGYTLYDGSWQESLDYDDVYGRMDALLGTKEQEGYHTKAQGDSYEYRISGLEVDITNAPLTPGNANQNFEADISVQIEIPFSFGWEAIPPLAMEIRTKANYMPKF